MMRHTLLTTRNYASFAAVMLAVGLATTGFTMVDLLMVAPKGVSHAAAVGEGGLIVLGISVFFLGVIDAFAGRLSVAEGKGTTGLRLPALAMALLLALAACELAALVIALGCDPALALLGQRRELVPLIGSFIQVRMYGLFAVMLYAALNEALKTVGAKNLSLATLLAGFGVNALLDWVFLYTGAAHLFATPESAIALATVLAQVFMASLSAWMFLDRIRARGIRFPRPGRADVVAEFRSAMLAGSGVGARNVNDYTSSIVPMLFIGTMGVKTLAAAVVAANIYTVFCRVPQACFQATFIFYGYAVGREDPGRARIVRTLLNYAAVPTACAALVVVAVSPWLVRAFASPGLDPGLARMLLLAYLLYLPAYLLDQSFARMLTVHQRGAVLFTSSTLATYLLTIPLAAMAVFVLGSAFLAVACSGVAITVQAIAYWRSLRGELPARAEVLVA